jgi:hypothetical protein
MIRSRSASVVPAIGHASMRGHCRGNQYEGACRSSTAHTYASIRLEVGATCGSKRVIVGSSEKCRTSPGCGRIRPVYVIGPDPVERSGPMMAKP